MEGMNKTGQGPALSEGPRYTKEDYGPSEGGSLQRGISYCMKMDAETLEPSGDGQMPPHPYRGSAERGTRFG